MAHASGLRDHQEWINGDHHLRIGRLRPAQHRSYCLRPILRACAGGAARIWPVGRPRQDWHRVQSHFRRSGSRKCDDADPCHPDRRTDRKTETRLQPRRRCSRGVFEPLLSGRTPIDHLRTSDRDGKDVIPKCGHLLRSRQVLRDRDLCMSFWIVAASGLEG